MDIHPLKALLQLQLASDEYAVIHLPYVLASLNAECFASSPHLHAWTTRISSLLNSKNAGSRWAGLCIAYKTSVLSQPTMIEYGQRWVGIALSMLSKREPFPTIKSAIHLLSRIFDTAKSVPEFQRQVVLPIIPKFSLALIELTQNSAEDNLKVVCMNALTRTVELFPAQHKALHPNLSALSSKFLEGSAPHAVNNTLLEAASHLHSVLYLTAGKVGAANLWRKYVDETIASAWAAFLELRTTFPENDDYRDEHRGSSFVDDPLTAIPLRLNRLRFCVVLLCHFMRTSTHDRAVQVPVGGLAALAAALISCTTDRKREGHIDPALRAMEVSVVPSIWDFSCTLVNCLSECVGHHFTAHASKIISYLAFHLEQNIPPSQRLNFLHTLENLLSNSHPIHDTLLLNRLAKAILLSLSVVLAVRSDDSSSKGPTNHQSKKERKRMRGYEGAEIFNTRLEVICSTNDDGNVLTASLDVMQLVLLNPVLSPALFSIASRVLLSMLCALQQISPASLSPDASLHIQVSKKIQMICTTVGLGPSNVMSRNLNLAIAAVVDGGAEYSSPALHRDFEIFLHPRVPPLLRTMVEFDPLSFTPIEEQREEADKEPTNSTTLMEHQQRETMFPVVVPRENPDVQLPEHNSHSQQYVLPQESPKEIPNTESNQRTSISAIQEAKGTSTMADSHISNISWSQSAPIATQIPVPQPPPVTSTFANETDDDEPMPSINMDSDSD